MKITSVTALIVSTALVAPLMYLEARIAGSDLPYPLFVVLWLVPAMLVVAAAPLVHDQMPCLLGVPNCD